MVRKWLQRVHSITLSDDAVLRSLSLKNSLGDKINGSKLEETSLVTA